jgi:hypothetical protein
VGSDSRELAWNEEVVDEETIAEVLLGEARDLLVRDGSALAGVHGFLLKVVGVEEVS